jgi:tetratricopeptide (TPR) repeat protein
VRRLTGAQRDALAGDLGELMGLLAQAKWREAEARPEAERRALAEEAWKLNSLARACFAGGRAPPALDRLAAEVAPAAGEAFAAGAPREAADARGRFLDAAGALASGRYADAIKLLDRVLTEEPNHAAAHFCLAACRQQKGQWDRALERYDAAAVVLPKDPRPAYRRGLIYGTRNRPAQAEEEFTKALALDPDFADALRHRAVARYRLGDTQSKAGREKEAAKKFAEAEADLAAALGRGAPAAFAHFVRARVRDRLGDRAGAEADRKAVAGAALKTEEDFAARGWSRMEADPEGAAGDFRKALELNPRSLVALQNLAHLYAEKLKDNDKALAVIDRVVKAYPEYAPGAAGRAVLLARMGRRAEAHADVERARLLSDDAEILYQAACVYSLTSKEDEKDLPRAVKLLRESLRKGYANLRRMATDPDLEPLRATGEFQEIRRAADTLYR